MSTPDEIQILSRNLIHLRHSRNLTQKEMAAVPQIRLLSLQTLESGQLPPQLGIDFIFRIREYFCIQPRQLFVESSDGPIGDH